MNTKRQIVGLIVTLLALSAIAAAQAEDAPATQPATSLSEEGRLSGDDSPPMVLKTQPAAFAANVDPALGAITVTFDQPMQDGAWSWTGGGDTYPKIVGQVAYDQAKTTCSLPVQLDPGKVYWMGINSPSYQNFQNAAYVPARRYAIVFATAGPDGKPTPIPEQMAAEAKEINAATGSPQ